MGDKINITFETLFDILRKEKNTEDLQKLEPDFFDDVVRYLNEKIEILNKDEFSELEKERTRKQIESIKKMIRDLYERREKKIIMMAINKSRTGIDGTERLLEKEKEFFDETLNILNKYRKEILFNTLDGKYLYEKKQGPEEKDEKKIKKETKLVRLLQPVQKFIGKELEIYGPFETDDVANLPPIIADILINKGIAEEIKEE